MSRISDRIAKLILALDTMLPQLDTTDFDAATQKMRYELAHGGQLVFTGVGKSYLIGLRAASTYASLGIPARCEDCISLLHGGIGGLRDHDLLLLVSKSGMTGELRTLARMIGHYKVIWVTTGAVHDEQALVVHVPHVTEMDGFGGDLVPTSSLLLTGAILDAIGLELAEQRGLTRDVFVKTHPGGIIGTADIHGGEL